MLRKREQQKEEKNAGTSAQKIVKRVQIDFCDCLEHEKDYERHDYEQKSVRNSTVKFLVDIHRVDERKSDCVT